jgi:uncharacterized protein (UPF0264 family)
LVSVRDEVEARAAVEGGAEIVDAKEPAVGSLGAVSPAVLAAIREAVPGRLGVSAALGDARDTAEVGRALGGIRVSLAYVKLGFRGVADPASARALISEATRLAAELPGRPGFIAVAYADWRQAGSLSPANLAGLVLETSAEGLLIDTAIKDGTTLFDICRVEQLAEIGRELTGDDRLFALGGGLALGDIPSAAAAGAGVFGVRTAACDGGRNGPVAVSRVRELAEALRLTRSCA